MPHLRPLMFLERSDSFHQMPGAPEPIPFGRYLLLQKLATGGMAEVYRANLLGVEGFEKLVAIKRILSHWSHNQDFISMLIDEAKIAVALNHPNIVQVYELGKEKEAYYIAMEYVEGFDLRQLLKSLKGEAIPANIVFYIIQEIAKGLHYAHSKTDAHGEPLGVVHRDISPQNIILSLEGEVKITDFGIAKAATKTHETVPGTFKGKFSYMSPEQACQEDIDSRSDLFSLGILFYELLTNQRLFGGGSDVSILDRVRAAAITFPDTTETLATELKEIVLTLLRKDSKERYATAQEFLVALHDYFKSQSQMLLGGAHDLAQFLRNNLPQEIETKREESTRVMTQTLAVESSLTKTQTQATQLEKGTQILVSAFEKKKPARWRAARWPLGLAGIALAGYVGYHFLPTKLTPPSQSPQPQIINKSNKPSLQSGQLSVQVIPWGEIYVDAQKKGWESPMKPTSFTVGPHQLRIFFKPQKKWLTKKINIHPQRKTHCIARFSDQDNTLECTP